MLRRVPGPLGAGGRGASLQVDFAGSAAPFSRWTGCALLLMDRYDRVLTGLSQQVLWLFLLHCSGCWFRVDIRAVGLSVRRQRPCVQNSSLCISDSAKTYFLT